MDEFIVIGGCQYERKDLEALARAFERAKRSGNIEYWSRWEIVIARAIKEKPEWTWPKNLAKKSM